MCKISFTPVVGDARGHAGRAVFTAGRSGPVLRIRTVPSNPRSTAQTQVRGYLTDASREFKALSSGNVAAWNAYALTISKHNPVTGQAYHPSGMTAYMELATKYKQANAGGTPPTTPPAAPFAGDGETCTVAGGVGLATWTASGANAADVKMEKLYQLLASPARAIPSQGYKSGGFYAATGGALTSTVSLAAGTYAVGYREVLTTTGQATEMVTTGKVTVT